MGLLAVVLAACGSNGSADTAHSADEIVDVPHSSVKSQQLSNCWLYATLGWAESLHVATGEPALDVSESYLSYWNWFDKLVWDGAPGRDKIDETGFFHQGMDLIARFGLMTEADFPAARQSTAKAAIDRSMREGALKTKEARMNKRLVRRELDAAWELSPEVVAKMNAVFGEAYDRSLDQPGIAMPEGSPIKPASKIAAMVTNGTETRRGTLADALGQRNFEQGWGKRTGAFAWNEIDYPTEPSQQRAFQIRFQKALHARQPVVISWMIDFAALSGSVMRGPPARPGRQGGHVTVLEDYQINDVPGFGSLKAGVAETRPEALNAALDPAAKIEFLRTKNSWGEMSGPAPEFSGYLDLYMPYLNGPVTRCTKPDDAPIGTQESCVDGHVPLWRVALPTGF